MGIAEFIIGRAFARPVGSTHPAASQNARRAKAGAKRHCERSEAIQLSAVCGIDCFVASAPRNDVDGLVHKAISKSRSPIDRLRNPGWLDTLVPATATLHGVVFDILVWRAPGRPFACPDHDRRWLTEP
jgi:hypothetical protein